MRYFKLRCRVPAPARRGDVAAGRRDRSSAVAVIAVPPGEIITLRAAVAVYLNSLNGEFVYDDHSSIVNNRDVFGDQVSLGDIFSHNFWGVLILYWPRLISNPFLGERMNDEFAEHQVRHVLRTLRVVAALMVPRPGAR